jgi:hypothetical protein
MAEEERKAVSGFFAVFLGCGRRVEYATLVHKDIFEAAPVQRIWGLKKDTGKKEKQLTTKQICNSMYTEANGRSYSKENIQYGK